MKDSSKRKIVFCNNLAGIRDKIVKADGALAGGSRDHFDVSDIDLTRVWQSMHGKTQENETAKAAVRLMSEDSTMGKIGLIVCLNIKAGVGELAHKIAERCSCSPEAAHMVAKSMKDNGMDGQKVLALLRDKTTRVARISSGESRSSPTWPNSSPALSGFLPGHMPTHRS